MRKISLLLNVLSNKTAFVSLLNVIYLHYWWYGHWLQNNCLKVQVISMPECLYVSVYDTSCSLFLKFEVNAIGIRFPHRTTSVEVIVKLSKMDFSAYIFCYIEYSSGLFFIQMCLCEHIGLVLLHFRCFFLLHWNRSLWKILVSLGVSFFFSKTNFVVLYDQIKLAPFLFFFFPFGKIPRSILPLLKWHWWIF
jgi:hypothetical protein